MPQSVFILSFKSILLVDFPTKKCSFLWWGCVGIIGKKQQGKYIKNGLTELNTRTLESSISFLVLILEKLNKYFRQ